MSKNGKDIVVKPHKGFQEHFTSTNVDVCFGAGGVGNGKSYSLVLSFAEPLMTDGDFRCLITRMSLGNLKAGGGFVDTFKDIFGEYVGVKVADNPRITFPSGAYCDLTYLDPANIQRLRERAKGWQYDAIAIDELTEMPWEVFIYMMTRNRGRSKTFTGKFRATFNPNRRHWTRQFVDWYIGVDGRPLNERVGRVRYFYINGSSVNDVIWGDTKEEVYSRARRAIDQQIADLKGKVQWQDFIKSFVLYTGTVEENDALIKNNAGYVGSVAASGSKSAAGLLSLNFNADPDEEINIPIPNDKARDIFSNDPCTNGDLWVTVDLADYGTDNLVALAWNGFHVFDMLVLCRSTPRENAEAVHSFAQKNGVNDRSIIYDATAGRYFNDYIPDAQPYISNHKPYGLYALTAMRLKDLCYMRLVKMINNGGISFSEEIAQQLYKHQNLKFPVTVEAEVLEECSVVRFDEMMGRKLQLWSKKKMNTNLGKGRSMDVLDPMAMRMLPCVNVEYGNELAYGEFSVMQQQEVEKEIIHGESIYNDSFWF